jgi:ketosteroid isomerase-like protein
MTDPAVEQEIIRLAHEWMEAGRRRDRAALEHVLAEDFLIAGWRLEGQLSDRATYVEDCLRPVDVEQASYTWDRWNVRVYGDTALANGVLTMRAVVAGKECGGVFLLTQVWMRRDGRWQVVACHSSPVFDAQGKTVG